MLSIFNWFGYRELEREGFEKIFRLIQQAGFEGVLIWWDEIENIPDYRDAPALARRAGLFVENMHTQFNEANRIWEDSAAGQALFEYYLRCVDDCAQFEIPTMVVHSIRRGSPPPASELGMERFARVIDRAERKGVNVALENQRSPEQLTRVPLLLERFGSPRFGLCYDSGHHNARELRAPEADMLARFGHRLMALHLHDNDGADDQHLLPFDGTTDWAAQMRAIAQTGYAGPTALEVVNEGCRDKSPEEFLALAYERARRLEALRL
jgi:sugar phosphate isomerase/epimerase